jgi:hypothetical protein
MSGFDGDPDHPILADPYTWELVEFTYRRDPDRQREPYFDLVLTRGGRVRRLRFFSPRGLEICRGMPSAMGMCILDVSRRQLDGLRVRVANFEQSSGAPTFWAARVVDVTDVATGGVEGPSDHDG